MQTKGKPEVTIADENQVSLPEEALRELGWKHGDRLIVSVLGNGTLVLARRPESWHERFSGKMGDVWGDHEDNMRYLDEERATWSERFPVPDSDGD